VAAGGASLLVRLQTDQAAARRGQDKDRVLLLGMVISEIKNREIELKRDATDEDIVDVIRKAIKKRKESVAMYAKANRPDLADREQAEAVALEAYTPAQVDAQGAANVGAVMAQVMPQFKGRADGGTINAIAREELTRG
jgi:uncharacterized protein